MSRPKRKADDAERSEPPKGASSKGAAKRPRSKRSKPAPPVVLGEDKHLIAIDKPAGILTVPASDGRGTNLQDVMRRRALRTGEECHPVHRLDRDTTGVLLFAKTRPALSTLLDAFKERTVSKTYLALVHGRPSPKKGTIRTYIAERGMTATSSPRPIRGGREAITRYRTIEAFRDATLIECSPETGRFNQIRVHFSGLGHPLVGERKYAVASRHALRFKRPVLHAVRLQIVHPASGARTTFESPLPTDVATLLNSLRTPPTFG